MHMVPWAEWAMIRSWIWCGILSTIGLVALVMPETGGRLFSLSEGHGPSPVDALGGVLIVAGWTVLELATGGAGTRSPFVAAYSSWSLVPGQLQRGSSSGRCWATTAPGGSSVRSCSL